MKEKKEKPFNSDSFLEMLERIERKAREFPKKKILDGKESLTYKELFALSYNYIKLFKKRKLKKGQYLLVVTDCDSEAISLLVAALKTGVVPLFIQEDFSSFSGLRGFLEKAQFDFIFLDKDFFEKLKKNQKTLLLKKFKKSRCFFYRNKRQRIRKEWKLLMYNLASEKKGNTPKTFFPDDEALILMSSGTTGASKLLPLSRENLWNQLNLLSDHLPFEESEKVLNIFNLSHVDGIITGFLYSLKTFSTSIRLKRKEHSFSAKAILRLLEEQEITGVILLPAIFQVFLKERLRLEEDFKKLTHLKFFLTGADYIQPHLWKSIEEKTKKRIFNLYGMSEIGTIATVATPEDAKKTNYDTIGQVVADHYLVVNNRGEICKKEEPGEFLVAGKTVIKRYLGDPLPLVKIKERSYFATGDLVSEQSEGLLKYCGRKKNIIITSGRVVLPKEVDSILLQNKDIQEALTFPLPDEVFGERVACAVVAKKNSPLTEQDILNYLIEKLDFSYKYPKAIKILNALPKTPSGKIKVEEVKETFVKGFSKKPILSDTLSPKDKIQTVISKVLSLEKPIDLKKRLSEDPLWDSIVHFDIIIELEKVFSIQFDLSDIYNLERGKDFVAIVEKNLKKREEKESKSK